MTKPFLKWAGGKSRVAPHILPVLGKATHLVEPFAGSCALFLASDFASATLSDINPDLIRLFKTVQQHGTAFIDYTQTQYFNPQSNTKERYLELRAQFDTLKTLDVNATDPKDWDRSALFVYLNRHGFNGMCRYNASGGFNIPYGQYTNPMFPRAEMEAFAQRCKNVTFLCQSFTQTMDDAISAANPDTVVYCDPPYIPLSKTASFVGYAKDGFTIPFQETLAQKAWACKQAGMRVVVSNHDVQASRNLYEHGLTFDGSKPLEKSGKATRIEQFLVRRSISAKGSSRGGAPELLAIYEP